MRNAKAAKRPARRLDRRADIKTSRKPAAPVRPTRETFRLSQSPSHLLRRAEQFAAELFARSELHDGVTLRQTVLLAAIAEAEGASQSDLVRITGVDRSTLAEMMARMERKGLIARAAAADDGRAKSVRLMGDGRRSLEAALPAIRAVDRALMAALPASQRAAFQSILAGLAETAEQQHDADEAERPAKKAPPKTRVRVAKKKASAKRPAKRRARR